MSGRGLNLKYYTGKVSSDSDNQKSKSLGLKNLNNLRREFNFLNRISTWQKMTFKLDFYTMGTNIKCRNQWKIEKLSLSGNLFCIFPFCTKTINRQICGFRSVKSRSSLGQTRSRVKYFSWNYAIMAMTFGECNFYKYFTTMRNKILLLTIFHVSSQTLFEQGIFSSIPRTSPGWRYASSYPPQRNRSLILYCQGI